MTMALFTTLLIGALVIMEAVRRWRRRSKATKPVSSQENGSTIKSPEQWREQEGQLLEQARDAILNGNDALARDFYREADSTKENAIRLRMQYPK